MKKFGTPMGAGPTVASEKPGFVGAGAPVGVVSCGASIVTAGASVLLRSSRSRRSALQSRPEVELEHLRILTSELSVFVLPLDCLRVTPFAGPAAGSGELPGVAVPAASGDGEAVAVCSGEACGVGASAVGACVAVSTGAWVGVSAGVSTGGWVTSGAALSTGAGAMAAGVPSGEPVGAGSWAVETAPRMAANTAATASAMTTTRRVIGAPAPGGRRERGSSRARGRGVAGALYDGTPPALPPGSACEGSLLSVRRLLALRSTPHSINPQSVIEGEISGYEPRSA